MSSSSSSFDQSSFVAPKKQRAEVLKAVQPEKVEKSKKGKKQGIPKSSPVKVYSSEEKSSSFGSWTEETVQPVDSVQTPANAWNIDSAPKPKPQKVQAQKQKPKKVEGSPAPSHPVGEKPTKKAWKKLKNGNPPQRITHIASSHQVPSSVVITQQPGKTQKFFGAVKEETKLDDKIIEQIESIIGVSKAQGWSVVDHNIPQGLVMISSDHNAPDLARVEWIRGIIVSLPHKKILVDSFGYGPTLICDEIVVSPAREHTFAEDNSVLFAPKSETYVISGHRAIDISSPKLEVEMVAKNTVLTSRHECMVVRIYKVNGQVFVANHNKLSIAGGQRQKTVYKDGKTVTKTVNITPSQINGVKFIDMTIEALGLPLESLFDPNVETSVISYHFMIVHPVFAIASRCQVKKPFAIYLNTFQLSESIDDRDVAYDFGELEPVGKIMDKSGIYKKLTFKNAAEANAHLRSGYYQDEEELAQNGYTNPQLKTSEGVLAIEFYENSDGTLSDQIKRLVHLSPAYFEARLAFFEKDVAIPMTSAARTGFMDNGHTSEFDFVQKVQTRFQNLERYGTSPHPPFTKKDFHARFASCFFAYDTNLTSEDLLSKIEQEGFVRSLPAHPKGGHVLIDPIAHPEDALAYYRKQIWLNYFIAAPFGKQEAIAKMDICSDKQKELASWIVSKIKSEDNFTNFINGFFSGLPDLSNIQIFFSLFSGFPWAEIEDEALIKLFRAKIITEEKNSKNPGSSHLNAPKILKLIKNQVKRQALLARKTDASIQTGSQSSSSSSNE